MINISQKTFIAYFIIINITFMKPYFSIAIPAYEYHGKGVFYLEQSFRLLSQQVFQDFEVVIADHSITDEIEILCKKWSNILQIKYIRNAECRGIHSVNLNVALSNSKGDWIKILFQDDYLYDTESLLITKEFIESKKNMTWMSARYIHDTGHDVQNLCRDFVPMWVDNIWTGNNLLGSPSGITIKNQDIIFFSPEFVLLMDCDFYMRMFKKYGKPEILSDAITVVNRVNIDRLENSISSENRYKEYLRSSELYG